MSARQGRTGFTLAEVAVTIAVVGLALVWMLQALNAAKLTAAQTRNLKLARELGLQTLGQIESGLFEEDLVDDRLDGTYAEEGYPELAYEVLVGSDQSFRPPEDSEAFDNWLEERRRAEYEDDDEEAEQPYEVIQIKVVFPPVGELKNELILERWLPWKQVHPDDEAEATAQAEGSQP